VRWSHRSRRRDCRESDPTRSPAMRSTIASVAARPASIGSWPGWPKTTPVILLRLPCTERIARNAKHRSPPATDRLRAKSEGNT